MIKKELFVGCSSLFVAMVASGGCDVSDTDEWPLEEKELTIAEPQQDDERFDARLVAEELEQELGLVFDYEDGQIDALAAEEPDEQDVYSCSPKGMTWSKLSHRTGGDWWNPTYASKVGSHGSTNPYSGDTSCAAYRRVLCFKPTGAPKPSYLSDQNPPYNGWAGGEVRVTPYAILGYSLTSIEDADATCEAFWGAGYRMASWHEASGWGVNFWAYDRSWDPVPYNNQKFWTYINDQPANCWNSCPSGGGTTGGGTTGGGGGGDEGGPIIGPIEDQPFF